MDESAFLRQGIAARHTVAPRRRSRAIPARHLALTRAALQGTSLRDVCDQFKVGLGSLHALVHQTCRRADPGLYARLEAEACGGQTSLLDRLREHADAFLGQTHYVPALQPRACHRTPPAEGLPALPAADLRVTATEFRRGLSHYLDRVCLGGAEVTVTSHARPLVQMVPLAAAPASNPVRRVCCNEFRSSAKEVFRLVAVHRYTVLLCQYETPVAALVPVVE